MKICIQLCALIAALSVHAQGYVECITDFVTAPGTQLSDAGTIGFTFRANQELTITEIGVFSAIFDTIGPIDVAIWDGSSNVLGSAKVSSTSTLYKQTRYELLQSPVSLHPSQVYFIGAYLPAITGFGVAGGIMGGSYGTDPGITVLGLASSTNEFLSRPIAVANADGIVPATVNYRYPGVPEPAVLGLVLLGGSLVLGRRLKKS